MAQPTEKYYVSIKDIESGDRHWLTSTGEWERVWQTNTGEMLFESDRAAQNKKTNHKQEKVNQERESMEGRGRSKPKGGMFRLILMLLTYATAGAIMFFLLLRAHSLYEIAFERWGLGQLGNTCWAFNVIPFLGGPFANACTTISQFIRGLLPFLVLILLTVFQGLITFGLLHPAGIRAIVSQMRWNRKQNQELQKEQGDGKGAEFLINRHNRLSEETLRNLLILSTAAFIAEAFIIWTARSGRSDLGSVLADALGFDLVLAGTLMIRNVFAGKPPKQVRRYEG